MRYNHQDARVYGNTNAVGHGNTITRNELQYPSFFLIVLTAIAGATLLAKQSTSSSHFKCACSELRE